MRERYPAAALMILADLVKATGDPDPHAIEAARLVDGKLAIPDFGSDRDPGMTDFNDLFVFAGKEEVAKVIASATTPAKDNDETLATGDSGWPEPQPLPNTLKPVAPFDPLLLPGALRPWVSDIAERMQCPPDFPAVGAMVALSSVIGRKVCIAPKQHDDWRVIPNLWGMIVGRPGVMKSPALSEVLKPLGKMQTTATEQHHQSQKEADISATLQKMTAQQIRKNAEKLALENPGEARALLASIEGGEESSPLRRYKVTDSSVEALGEILMETRGDCWPTAMNCTACCAVWTRKGRKGRGLFTCKPTTAIRTIPLTASGEERICISLRHVLPCWEGFNPASCKPTSMKRCAAARAMMDCCNASECWCGRIFRRNTGMSITTPTLRQNRPHSRFSSVLTPCRMDGMKMATPPLAPSVSHQRHKPCLTHGGKISKPD
jgi:hypothetical protein